MNEGQQLFALFYAILYGALATVTHRWRPFQFGHAEGKRRGFLFAFLLLACPFLYFAVVIVILGTHSIRIPHGVFTLGFLQFLVLFLWLGPMIAFYSFWVYIITRWRETFYQDQEWAFLGLAQEEELRSPVVSLVGGMVFFIVPAIVLVIWLLTT